MSQGTRKHNWSVSVRQFVTFTRDSGHISSRGQWQPSAQAGQEGHQRLQGQRPEHYHAEVPLKGVFTQGNIQLKIQGRIDGIFTGATPIIEEIKTTVQPTAQLQTREAHWLQLYCYAWLFLKTSPQPYCLVQLTYYNLEHNTEKSFQVCTTRSLLEAHFNPKLTQYLTWLKQYFAHRQARNTYLSSLHFPYEYERPQQVEIMADVRQSLKAHQCLLLEASTGIGKTAAVTFPALQQLAKSLRSRVFCLTAKITTQTNALEFLKRVSQAHPDGPAKPLKILQITAQERTCVCDAQQSELPCSLQRNHYQKIQRARQAAFEQNWLDTPTIQSLAQAHQVCPYRLQFELVPWVDVIIGDYNYVFDPRANVLPLIEQDLKQTYLLIDECHNLIDRTRDMYSANLDFRALSALKQRFYAAPPAFAHSIDQTLAAAKAQHMLEDNLPSLSLQRACAATLKLLEQQLRVSADLVDHEILEIYFDLHFFHRLLEMNQSCIRTLDNSPDTPDKALSPRPNTETFTTTHIPTGQLQLYCVDPAPLLTPLWQRLGGAVLFSGTLQPATYYQKLLGLDTLDDAQYNSYLRHFAEQVTTELLPIDTRYRQRAKATPLLVDAIFQMTERLPGNHFVFFPSYKFMHQVHHAFTTQHPDITTCCQQSKMSLQARGQFLAQFLPNPEKTRVGFVVMGGVFGEGVDLPGDRLMGVMLVSIGLPMPDARIRAIEQYFGNEDHSGFSYAFLYPSLCRTLQASGRLIRTDEDEGILILADQRFGQPAYLDAFAAYEPRTAAQNSFDEFDQTTYMD